MDSASITTGTERYVWTSGTKRLQKMTTLPNDSAMKLQESEINRKKKKHKKDKKKKKLKKSKKNNDVHVDFDNVDVDVDDTVDETVVVAAATTTDPIAESPSHSESRTSAHTISSKNANNSSSMSSSLSAAGIGGLFTFSTANSNTNNYDVTTLRKKLEKVNKVLTAHAKREQYTQALLQNKNTNNNHNNSDSNSASTTCITCTTPASTEETIRTVTTTQTPVTAATKATIQGASTPAGAVPPTGAGATTPRASATITTTSGVRSTLKARAKKETKTKLKSLQAESDNANDNGDRDGDGDEDVDKESDGSIYDDEVEVIPTNNTEVGQWNEENYSNDEFWDSNSYNLEEHEWRGKRKWNTPAACMESGQRKRLENNVKTMDKVFSRYSQRPGKGYPANEFVLLQMTDINGVGHKGEACRRKKTAVIAYGRTNAVTMYKSWLESTIKGDDNFVNHSATDLKTFTNFWKTEEEDLAGEEVITSSTSTSNTENGNAADSPILKVGGNNPTRSKSTPDDTPPHQNVATTTIPKARTLIRTNTDDDNSGKDSRDDNMLVDQTMNQHQHNCVDDDNNEYDSSDDEAVELVMNQRNIFLEIKTESTKSRNPTITCYILGVSYIWIEHQALVADD
ncbi:hypothetical protein FRACYDRAFT_248135 [Fragilariopsis cylindrus CCMP1102]|uniref:Uncharacterized protein n=1 Tax=Fragilariopsis cylindrus CCMP1102 TaxID=635003 RepID=A0A1E7EVR2_9STRA|nr:hypothetical protein FRACYDRAFT_248135 [Fragilariopsis cylindrus CCMP1102]|eukprot:OEU09885.1 hypothetical protein FRACYDRAFT_248135 [Fragilariopsis cylindrus CCMP1102]